MIAQWKGKVDRTFQFHANKILNDSDFLDYYRSFPLLLLWVKTCSALGMEELIHSASFPICQSSGMGKTKLVAQLCRRTNEPSDRFWLINTVCRDAQNMEMSPLVKHLMTRLFNLQSAPPPVLPASVTQATIQSAVDEGPPTKDEDLIQTLMTDVIHVVSQVLQAILDFQDGKLAVTWPPGKTSASVPLVEQESKARPKRAKKSKESERPPSDEEAFYRLFQYAEDDEELKAQQELFHRILSYPPKTDIKGLVQKLRNPKVVFVWDEARGLFPGNKFDDDHAQLMRAVRRASTRIATSLKSSVSSFRPTFCFIFMDTSARVTNFLKPMNIDPSQLRMRFRPERKLPPMPSFSFVTSHDDAPTNT